MIRVGTSGFGYHGWCPGFYPAGLPYEEYLSFYADRLACCELNHTFFRIPTTSEMEELSLRAPSSFRFSVKLTRGLTHERGNTLEMARYFAAAVSPLMERGQLVAVVAQFPYSFVNNPYHRAYLSRLRAALDLPLVAELRNGSWRHPETIDFLRGWGIGWVAIDAPLFEKLPPPAGLATSAVGYVRLHGREAGSWWRKGTTRRYDYRYRKRELLSWLPRVREIARSAAEVFVVFNNRGRGHAVTNAMSFAKMLRDASRGGEGASAGSGRSSPALLCSRR